MSEVVSSVVYCQGSFAKHFIEEHLVKLEVTGLLPLFPLLFKYTYSYFFCLNKYRYKYHCCSLHVLSVNYNCRILYVLGFNKICPTIYKWTALCLKCLWLMTISLNAFVCKEAASTEKLTEIILLMPHLALHHY